VRETDLIIRLANEVNIPLLIMGSWPDEGALKALAGDTVQFVGQVHDPAEKIAIMQHARGLINLAKESCGMATMEALALGVPVLGYTAWATPELVWSHAGILAQSKDIPHLIDTFRTFHSMQRDRTVIKKKFLEKIGK
jgi:glycosyltransferase involved in cell wall biosynthesis